MYYVDRFLNQLVTEIDTFAAPERYYEYRKGIDGIIKETYIVSYNPLKLINFAYTVDEDKDILARNRNAFFKEHDISGYASLYAYTVPPKWYEEEVAKVEF